MMFDVRDVLRALNVEPEPSVSWPVGWAIRDAYLERFERLPDKALRPKTNGGGTHCFAVYPDTFWYDAKAVARSALVAIKTAKARQPDMFGDAGARGSP
jgi:hypothetical protein